MLSIPSDSHLVSTNFELESYLDNLYYTGECTRS